MFIGREKELASLEQLYASGKFEFAVIYGRRRVGKTALISQFIKEKKAIYFMGVESSAGQNLENLSRNIMEYSTGILTEASFSSFQSALEYVFRLAKEERLILAIDEYPYVARSSGSLASTLQLLIDQYGKNVETDADPLRFFHVLYGGSGIGLQGAALWQEDSTDQASSL